MTPVYRPAMILPAFLRQRDGAAATEFAIMLPLLLILLFGGIEIGRVLHDYHTVVKSVRDAGRFAARFPVSCGGSLEATRLQQTQYLALTGSTQTPGDGDYLLAQWTDPDSVQVSVVCIDNSGGTFTGLYADSGAANGAMAEIPTIQIEATAPFTFLFAAILGLPGELSLTLRHQQVHVGE